MKVESGTPADPLAQVLQSAQAQQTDMSERLLKVLVTNQIDLTSLDTMGKLFDQRV